MKKILVLIFTFIICGCGYDKYAIPEGAYITIDETPIETYNELNLYDLIEDTNVEITTDNNSLDTTKLGKNTITIDYVYEKRDYKFDISYEVVDTTPPTFISASSVRTIIKNNDAYFCDNIVYADDYDKHPTCRIEGEYDLTTTGVYNVQYILEDQSGNTKSKNLKINVVDEISSSGGSSSSSNQNHLEFSDAISKYKTDTTEIGIDVSRWQGEIDWQKVKDAGVEFVIMRIGVQSDYDKEISVDSYYYQNIQGAKDVGLKVGVYVYTTAINKVVNILSKSGITLTTSNGRNERIETAVKRGLHGSIKTTAEAIAKQIGNDIGYNCVRIGHSYKCRPSHHPIDDVTMSKEEFKKYEYLTEEYNCNHFVNYLWLEEFEKSSKTIYGDEHGNLEEVRKNYEYRQKLNYLKNQVKSKRNAIASGNNSVKLKNELRNARIKLNTFLSNSKKDTNIKVVVLNKGMEFKYKGKTYIVDGKNVKNEFNSKEREFANWLANNTNKTVALNPKINEPDGIKVPDLKIDNEYYDMKIITGSSKQIIYHNVYGKHEQASNFLFEASSSPLTLEELKNQVYKVFKRTDVTHVKKIGIKKNSDFILLKKE